MPTKDEDLTLVSMLTAHPADVLPYFRLPHFLDLFPTRRKAAEWVTAFWDTNNSLPKLSLLKKSFPAIQTLQSAEPLPYCYDQLRRQYIDTIAATAGEKMTDALDKRDMQDFLKHNIALTDMVSAAEKPIGAVADDTDNYVEQLGLSLDKDSTNAMKVMPTDFTPFDDEDGGGMRPGHIYVLASLVNLGKTYVSLKMAENLRKNGYRVIYTSTEMPKEDLMMRALALRFGLNVDQLISREQPQASIDLKETKEEWYKKLLQQVQSKVDADTGKGKLFIRGCDDGVLTPRQIRADAKELTADAVFIDAAQDIRDDKLTKERTPALYNAVSELNQIVKALNLALFVTVQLDPDVEKKGLTQGNLNRIQWAQVFAQKAHVVMTMLGSRDSDFRDMSIDKTRDGKAGRKFWLTFRFPEVQITASTKTPGTLSDLDKTAPAETLTELESALAGMAAPVGGPPPPPAISAPPAIARMTPAQAKRLSVPPKRVDPQTDEEPSISPYAERRDKKAAKKPPWKKHGKR